MQEVFLPQQAAEPKAAYDWSMPRPAHSPRSEVGHRLASLRQAKGLTQKQIAEKVSVSQQDIAYWERQATAPRSDVLPKLATVLEVSVDELLGFRPLKTRSEGPKGRLHRIFKAASQLPRRQQQKIAEVIEPFIREHGNGHKQAA